ncbi:importin subunit alpha-2 [Micractinium conductrix]|uniref:Importin subunit alpha n=1 Tax=Micractinium conductrix TaxID=554055 RepID=A0A2P6VD69_9CHLO|nr:importin subunit alpha-2 [Micractinium conductrix]|eukprot:PSC72043.1 importin subunit alpha-2 [Micractinium conductrix]
MSSGTQSGGAHIPADRRADYKPVHAGDAKDRRRAETVAISKQSKESALRSKRLKRDHSFGSLPPSRQLSRDPSRASLGEAASEGVPPGAEAIPPEDVAAEVAAAVEAVKGAKPVGSDICLDAVRRLRQLLSNYDEPPFKEAVQAGAVPVLVAALQPPRIDGTALETIFEAAWALTNLAVGEFETVKAVLSAAPILIAYLGGGSGLPVAEQCAWALGNIAAEDFEFRQTLIANGVVRPLAALVVGARKALDAGADDGDPALSAGTTAAWALSNVLKGAGKEVGDVVAVDGALEALVRLVAAAPDHLSTEAAWVLAYITASHETHLNRLVTLGVVTPMLTRIAEAVDQMLREEQDGRALLIPLLRSLGNLAAGGGAHAADQLLGLDAAPALEALVVCAGTHHHGLQKEACWVISNVAGMPGRRGLEAVKAAGAVPPLMKLLKESPFHVRKEAAFALANICADGGGGTGNPDTINYLFAADRDALKAMVSLMRSADMDAARLGLQFTEMVLRLLDTGVEAVEEVDGIDAIEAVQYSAAPPELQRMAAALVDKYFGADAEE